MIKKQLIDKKGLIRNIISPFDIHINVMIIAPEDFMIYEYNDMMIDYCCIVDNYVFISSKASYNRVIINYC